MSDILEVVIEENVLELSFDDGLEILLPDDAFEVVVQDELEVVIDEDVYEILTAAEPGIPGGGSAGQVLAKKSDAQFDVEWVTVATKITVGNTPPVAPNVGDLWVDTN